MWASPPGWACCGLNTSSMPPPGGDASSVSSHDRGDFHLATGDYPDRPPPLTFIRPPAYTFAWPRTAPPSTACTDCPDCRGAPSFCRLTPEANGSRTTIG